MFNTSNDAVYFVTVNPSSHISHSQVALVQVKGMLLIIIPYNKRNNKKFKWFYSPLVPIENGTIFCHIRKSLITINKLDDHFKEGQMIFL